MTKLTCEITGKKINLNEGFLCCNPRKEVVTWHFTSASTIETENEEEYNELTDLQKEQAAWAYNIPCRSFFKSPESTIEWLAHLSEKTWFKNSELADLMYRLRSDGNICNAM